MPDADPNAAALADATRRRLARTRDRPPFGADEWATEGEVCTCGHPALVVYVSERGRVGFCGIEGRQPPGGWPD